MGKWLRQCRALAGNTFIVLLEDPFVFILNLFLLGAAVFFASLPGFTFGDQLRLFRDQVLALAFSGSCLAVVLGASHAIIADIRRGTVPVIMSRPVSGSALILGKWAGLMGIAFLLLATSAVAYLWGTRLVHFEQFVEPLGLAVYVACVLLTLVVMVVRHYLFRGAFVWPANLALPIILLCAFAILNFWGYNGQLPARYGALVDWRTLHAFAFLLMALAVFSSMVTCLSVVLDHAMLMGVSLLLFLAGLVVGCIVDLLPVLPLRAVAQVFLPNWQTFWIADRIAERDPIAFTYSVGCMVHSLGQALLYLWIGTWLFRRREVSGSLG